jgi:hypothetical protein
VKLCFCLLYYKKGAILAGNFGPVDLVFFRTLLRQKKQYHTVKGPFRSKTPLCCHRHIGPQRQFDMIGGDGDSGLNMGIMALVDTIR